MIKLAVSKVKCVNRRGTEIIWPFFNHYFFAILLFKSVAVALLCAALMNIKNNNYREMQKTALAQK